MLKPLLRKLRDSMSERGTNRINSSMSGNIPMVVRESQMQDSSSRKQNSNENIMMTDSFWYAREAEGKCERQGSPSLESDREMGTAIAEKPHFREADADAESLVSDM